MQQKGTVKKWMGEKGYGFIVAEDGGDDVFVHRNVIGETKMLEVGQEVIFTVDTSTSKRRATHISGPGLKETADQAATATSNGAPGMGKQQTGTVKTWMPDKGFGFIGPDGGGCDIFVLNGQAKSCQLYEGLRVQYTVGENPKTKNVWAENVTAICPDPMMMHRHPYPHHPHHHHHHHQHHQHHQYYQPQNGAMNGTMNGRMNGAMNGHSQRGSQHSRPPMPRHPVDAAAGNGFPSSYPPMAAADGFSSYYQSPAAPFSPQQYSAVPNNHWDYMYNHDQHYNGYGGYPAEY